MTEDLISGYTAFTSADEYGAATVGAAPGTTPLTPTVTATVILGQTAILSVSLAKHC